ncbi:MAG TPA: ABC transporter permease [Gammaproteobacteria bacterium]|nr:ABC transporter permease [Gammaproteobacteria bacterium]
MAFAQMQGASVPSGARVARACYRTTCRVGKPLLGVGILLALWYFSMRLMEDDPMLARFTTLGPVPTFHQIGVLWEEGTITSAVTASGFRLLTGLGIAIAIGVPVGIFMGRKAWFRRYANSPFQLLRMVSPLSWEPIAVIVFATWNQAIVFLIAITAVWPLVFSTAAALAKVDPAWFRVANNLGARPRHLVTQIIWPAIAFDVFNGIRLALGVAWIVLIPAEFLGVSSGIGYTLRDAQETLTYETLSAMVLLIGLFGFCLDGLIGMAVHRSSWHKRTESAA